MSRKDASTSGPVVFGQLFGWYHAPRRPAKAGGVVLCNPFGYEAMCLHRAYRTLAERLADAGMPTLRFDYHGTGDSAGGDHEPDRVGAWIASVHAAVAELRRRARIQEVSLFGIRFGATLAALAGSAQPDIASVVLYAPYLTGKSFLREMRMMQSAGAEQAFASADDRGASPSVRPTSTEGEEAIGFLLTAETVTALSAIDLRAGKALPASKILLLGRDDLPDDGRLEKHFTSLGARVTNATTIPGYAAMMQDAYLSKVPDEAFDRVVAWLGEVSAGPVEPAQMDEPEDLASDRPTLRDLSREGPHLVAKSVDEPGEVREEAFLFGPKDALLGILSEPKKARAARTDDVVLFLNVGSNHRIGSNRMYVKMARTLAARGITSLRFDVSGIGDSLSDAGAENRLYGKEAVLDVKAAMDELTSLREAKRFFLVGLCSGAYLAFQAAHEDRRVAGQILINTQTFRWKEGDTLEVSLRKNYRSTRFYTTEMWNPQVWGRVLRGEVNAKGIAGTLATRAIARAKRGALGSIARVRHGRREVDDVLARFKDIARRNTKTLLVFGQNDGGLDLMEAHLGPSARKMEKEESFQLAVVEGTDHTFTPLWSQKWLETLVVSTVERWRGS